MPSVRQANLIAGCAGSGKTDLVVRRVAGLLKAGVASAEVRVFCALPQAVPVLRGKLRQAGVPDEVAVCTPQAFAFEVLGSSQAQAFTGRQPRALLPFEEEFLWQDLLVVGTKEKRLKEMVKFFERNWTELADDDPHWLMEGEEELVHDHLKRCLAFLGAMKATEVSNFAVRFLGAHPWELPAVSCPNVVVDDFSLLSRASQVLCCLVASESIAVTVDPYESHGAFESYPYAEGVREFLQVNPHALVQHVRVPRTSRQMALLVNRILEARAASPVDGVPIAERAPALQIAPGLPDDGGEWRLQPGESPLEGAVRLRLCGSMADELQSVAAMVRAALEDGLAPREIAVVCPRTFGAKQVAETLRQEGIPCETITDAAWLAADVLLPGRSPEARMVALLSLAADPHNAAAWRAMGGFGDSTGRSLGFRAIREMAQKQGIGLVDVLRQLDPSCSQLEAEARPQAQHILQVYRQVAAVAAKLAGLRGSALLNAAARAVGIEPDDSARACVMELVGEGHEKADAPTMVRRIWGLPIQPRFCGPDAGRGVQVVTLQQASGLEPRLALLSSFVNGFLPHRRFFDKEALVQKDAVAVWEAGLRRLYPAVGAAREAFVAMAFTRIAPQAAQDLGVKVNRVRVENGERVCVVEPSVYAGVLFPE